MTVKEANARFKKTTINDEQLWQLNSIYLLLDFHKDDFCKLVEAIGLEKWLAKKDYYDRLEYAERDLAAKERYLKAKARLAEIENEKESLIDIVNSFQPI